MAMAKPPVECSKCKDAGYPGQMLSFVQSGYKKDGSLKFIPHDVNGGPHQHKGSAYNPRFAAKDKEEPDLRRPDQKPTIGKSNVQTPNTGTFTTSSTTTTPTTFTKECDMCRVKGVPGQWIHGVAGGKDESTGKVVWLLYEHDPELPTATQEHKTPHIHRKRDAGQQTLEIGSGSNVEIDHEVIPDSTGNVDLRQAPGLGTGEFPTDAYKNALKDAAEKATRKEMAQNEYRVRIENTLKRIEDSQEDYFKGLIRLIDSKFNKLIETHRAILSLQYPPLHNNLDKEIAKLANPVNELEWAHDPLILDALTNYDKKQAATPIVASRLLRENQPSIVSATLEKEEEEEKESEGQGEEEGEDNDEIFNL